MSVKKEAVVEMFRKFDKNGDGSISYQELTSVLQALDDAWDNDTCWHMFSAMDTNGNGKVTFQELADWVFHGSESGPEGAVEAMAQAVAPCSFLMRHAPNGQTWAAYCGPVPPAYAADGQLIGAWAECVYSGVVFELANPGWHDQEEYQDQGPVGYIIEYLCSCGWEEDAAALEEAEARYQEELQAAPEEGSRAFLQFKARNGRKWEEYLSMCEPKFCEVNGEQMVGGAWGEAITAAVIFEHENPAWDQLGPFAADGPAGQVIAFFEECGHTEACDALDRTEQATHAAVDDGGKVPVFDATHYQPPVGVVEAEIDDSNVEPSGRKKALLVGCNYPGSSAALNGCINDCLRWKRALTTHFGFKERDIVVLKDADESDSRKTSTRDNIVNGVRWLVQGAGRGDVLFFSFSGHGGQRPSDDASEEDGKDEVLIPTDYKDAGTLVDHELFDLLVVPLPSGCKLTVMIDACHSGSALDLPFTWNESDESWECAEHTWHTAGDVQMFSGCEDSQCSMDAWDHKLGRAGGAMTTCFCDVLDNSSGDNLSYPVMFEKLLEVLKDKNFEQRPKMTSSQQFAPQDKDFSLCDGIVPNLNEQLGQSGNPPAHAADPVHAHSGFSW